MNEWPHFEQSKGVPAPLQNDHELHRGQWADVSQLIEFP